MESEFSSHFGREAVIDLLREQIEEPQNSAGNQNFQTLLHQALYEGISGYDLQPIHYELACCVLHQPHRDQEHVIYTLNYDDILEKAMESVGGEKPRAITAGTPKDNSVIHLHGYLPLDIEKAEGTLILSEKDYLNTDESWADERLKSIFEKPNRDILLIGMSLRDPRLRRLLHHRASSKKQGGKVYAILSEFPSLTRPTLVLEGLTCPIGINLKAPAATHF